MAGVWERKRNATRLFRIASSGPRVVAALLVVWAFAAQAQSCPTPLAQLVFVKGSVELVRQGATRPAAVEASAGLCAGDTVVVRAHGQAALLLANATIVRLDQGTTVTISPAAAGRPALLSVLSGTIYVITRTPQPFRVRTPFINANVEGTEFVVRVSFDAAEIAVIEGRVVADNELGSVDLGEGEIARAERGAAPRKELSIRSDDAVQWTLHVPTLYGRNRSPDVAGAGTPAAVAEAAELQRQDRLDAALDRLDAAPAGERDGRWLLLKAHLLLVVGRLDEARPLLEQAAATPSRQQADALALRSVVALAQNDKDAALQHANRSLAVAPTPVGWLALSYVQQARFDLDGARLSVVRALETSPGNALARARLAELELAIGQVGAAVGHAEQAVAADPALAKTRTVLGFVRLANLEIDAALREFAAGIAADDADPEAHLGLGLALIRTGRLARGREEIELATSLDPARSLTRTYLGKAYFEEMRDAVAGTQWRLAIERDPLDPTPWFYRAIGRQAANRPVEALEDAETSLALNGNRAVYRSILLRDQDEAARAVVKARIYGDLGFDRLTLLAGATAIGDDPASFAAHRLLADAYVDVPRHDIARVSELLQSQLRQPLNFTPTQLQFADERFVALRGAGPAWAGLNEYNALFTRDGTSFSASGIVGANSTWGDQAMVAGVHGRWGYSVGQLAYRTDGFRDNNDFRKTIYDVFVQHQASYELSLQAEVRRTTSRYGDTVLRFDPLLVMPDRNVEAATSYRLGGRYRLGPSSDLLVSFVAVDGSFTNGPPGVTIVDASLRTRIWELQYARHGERFDIVAGAGSNTERNHTTFFGVPADTRPEAINAYVYGVAKVPSVSLSLHGGLSYDKLRATDSLGGSTNQINPKLGAIWQPTPQTTVRAAAFRTLKRRFLASQTLEPTQVAGFNQFFDDLNGTDARRTGVALDQRLSARLHGGIELSRRKLEIPQDFTLGELFEWREREASAYLYWTPNPRVALSARYLHERFERTPDFPGQELFTRVATHRLPLTADLRLPQGWSARLGATRVRQSGMFYSSSGSPDPEPGASRFWIADAAVSYRLPQRRGMLSVEVRNLFDRRFQYQETDLFNPLMSRNRTWFLRATVLFE